MTRPQKQTGPAEHYGNKHLALSKNPRYNYQITRPNGRDKRNNEKSVIPQLRVDFRAGGGTWQFQVNVVVGCARPLLAIENRSLPIRFKFKAGEFR